jgi:hypothetical protein
MRQGTTPKHTFTLPFDTNIVEKVRVVYAQRDCVKIVKEGSDVEMDGNTVSVKLTQEDTLQLNSSLKTYVQVRVVTHDGNAFTSDTITLNTAMCLDREVL